MTTSAIRRRRAAAARSRRARGAAWRRRVEDLGWHLGQGAWIVVLMVLIALQFAWGILLGLWDGVGMLRRAWAERHHPDPPALPPPDLPVPEEPDTAPLPPHHNHASQMLPIG